MFYFRKDVDDMLQRIEKLWSEKGQGIVEYALILAFVVAIAVIALDKNSGIGQSIKQLFTNTATQINDASQSTNSGTGGGSTGGGSTGG